MFFVGGKSDSNVTLLSPACVPTQAHVKQIGHPPRGTQPCPQIAWEVTVACLWSWVLESVQAWRAL